MALYRLKSKVITATQWFKPGDHRAVVDDPVDHPCHRAYCLKIGSRYIDVESGDWIIEVDGKPSNVMGSDEFKATYEPADS